MNRKLLVSLSLSTLSRTDDSSDLVRASIGEKRITAC